MFVFKLHAIRRIPRWLWSARYFFLTMAPTLAALFFTLRPGASEQLIRLTGLALQLVGGFTVMWTIAETRASFGHPSFFSKSMRWMRAFPLLRQPTIQLRGSSSLSGVTMKAYGHVRQGLPEDATMEQQLAALRADFEVLHNDYWRNVATVDDKIATGEHATKMEADARQRDIRELKHILEDSATGGLHIPAIGAVWIVVGSILSTVSPEICTLLKQ